MEETIDLAMGRGDHRRVVVAQVDDCGPASKVGVFLPVGGVNPDSLRAFSDHVGIEGDDGRDEGLMTGNEIAQRRTPGCRTTG